MSIECPYCETEQEVNHDDGNGYSENEKHQMTCNSCGKSFVFETSVIYFYEASKADCLNEGDHKYSPTRTFPKEYTEMECELCGDRRKPTDVEMWEIFNPPAGERREM